jgi:hypothetical protein
MRRELAAKISRNMLDNFAAKWFAYFNFFLKHGSVKVIAYKENYMAVKACEFVGTWHIDEMEMWDADYFNMEVQAYIQIDKKKMGKFQFGLVTGFIDGEIVAYPDGSRFEFTWEGNDECDETAGSGWVRLKEADTLEGRLKIHHGDSSKFRAKRATTAPNEQD